VLRFARELTAGDWSSRVIACDHASHDGAMRLLNDGLAEMAQGLSDWGSVDLLGVTVLGQAWREGQCPTQDRRVDALS
jgi:hypothetical protein